MAYHAAWLGDADHAVSCEAGVVQHLGCGVLSAPVRRHMAVCTLAICVVLPLPVSAITTTTGLDLIVATISSSWACIGRIGTFDGPMLRACPALCHAVIAQLVVHIGEYVFVTLFKDCATCSTAL